MHLLLHVCFVLAALQPSLAVVFSECGAKYMCWALKAYVNDPSQKILFDVGSDENLSPANIAIMMIHAFSQRRFKVVLKGLGDDISSIELKHVKNKEVIFSCSKEDENGSPHTVFKVKGTVKESTKFVNPLTCDIDLKSGSPIIEESNTMFELHVNYAAGPVFATGILGSPEFFYYCDPMQLKYKRDMMIKKKAYKKVNVYLNDFYCNEKYDENDIFGQYNNLEYHKADTSSYTIVNQLKCEITKDINMISVRRFNLDGASQDRYSDIDIRCVGDAKFFCDYDPKFVPDKVPMKRTKPNKASGIPSTIECPDSHPFFAIKGRAPVRKEESTFECLNYYGEMMWTIKDDVLTKNYPEVYCTDQKDCDIVHSSFLHSGSYINEENIPACHEGGQLWINKLSAEKCVSEEAQENCIKVEKFTCNKRAGFMVFHKKHQERGIKFEEGFHVFCDYPPTAQILEKLNKKNVQTIIIAGTVSGIVTFIVTSVIMFFVLRRFYRKQRDQIEKLKKADEAEAKRMKSNDFHPKDLFFKSDKSKRDSIKSGKGTATIRNSIAEKDKSSVKEQGRGFFAEKNERPLVELEAPKGLEEEMYKAFQQNTRERLRTDGFPKGYKMEVNEETKGAMQRISEFLKKNNKFESARESILFGKRQAMEKEKKALAKKKQDERDDKQILEQKKSRLSKNKKKMKKK